MNEEKNKRSVYVGLFVLGGIIFLIAGILMIGNLHETFKKKIKVIALFDNVSGLQTGNNIWFSGVKIGIVSKLRFFGHSQVEVTMKLETNTKQFIRKDAYVKIGTDGLIGNKILEVYGGTTQLPEITEGDTLGVEKSFSTDDMINMVQENNKNLLTITNDFKTISHKLVSGEGSIGKLLNDNAIYTNLNDASLSLQHASSQSQQLINSLNTFTNGLNKKGTLANQLVTDTIVFNSVKASATQLQHVVDKANMFVNDLKEAGKNPNTSIGMLLHDEETGARLKATIRNLESGSAKLDDDLLAAQHNFLLRGFFKKRAKQASKDSIRN